MQLVIKLNYKLIVHIPIFWIILTIIIEDMKWDLF